MAGVAVDHSHVDGNNPVTGHRFPLQLNTTTKSSTCTTPNHPFPANEKTHLPQLKPLEAALRLKTTQKKQVSTIQRNIHKQFYNSLTETPTEQAILLSQSTSHTGEHLMQPSSEAYEAEDRCFRVSVARRLLLPQSAAGQLCGKPVDVQQHHCNGCRNGGSVDRRRAAVARCLASQMPSLQM